MSDDGFTEEQRQYLQGFVAGADLARSTSGLPTFGQTLARNRVLPSPTATPRPSSPLGPESLQYEAQSRLLAEGKKLCPEEEAKRQKFPLDRWDELAARAANGQYPKGVDVLIKSKSTASGGETPKGSAVSGVYLMHRELLDMEGTWFG